MLDLPLALESRRAAYAPASVGGSSGRTVRQSDRGARPLLRCTAGQGSPAAGRSHEGFGGPPRKSPRGNAGGPGRACPVSYHYGAAALSADADLRVRYPLGVAGGLYGNPLALERLTELYEGDAGLQRRSSHGDFTGSMSKDFDQVDEVVHRFPATRGNVETELAAPAQGAGVPAAAYPEWSTTRPWRAPIASIERLRHAARPYPRSLEHLAALPMHRVAEIAGCG